MHTKAGPPTEPYFGRFAPPLCVYCNATDTSAPRNQLAARLMDATNFVKKEEAVQPGCAVEPAPAAKPEESVTALPQRRNDNGHVTTGSVALVAPTATAAAEEDPEAEESRRADEAYRLANEELQTKRNELAQVLASLRSLAPDQQ